MTRLFAVPEEDIVSPPGRWAGLTPQSVMPLVQRRMYSPVRKTSPAEGDVELKPGVETILDDVVFRDGTRVVQRLLLSEDGKTLHVESMPQVSGLKRLMARLSGIELPMKETMSV